MDEFFILKCCCPWIEATGFFRTSFFASSFLMFRRGCLWSWVTVNWRWASRWCIHRSNHFPQIFPLQHTLDGAPPRFIILWSCQHSRLQNNWVHHSHSCIYALSRFSLALTLHASLLALSLSSLWYHVRWSITDQLIIIARQRESHSDIYKSSVIWTSD